MHYRNYGFAYMMMAVHNAQRHAREAENYPLVEYLNIILHSALAMEALANHLGQEISHFWEPLKKKLSPIEKIEYLAAAKQIEIDWSKRPYQSVKLAFRFRNLVAHSESTLVPIEHMGLGGNLVPNIWQTYCTDSTANRIAGDVEQIIEELPILLGVEMPNKKTLAEQAP